LRQTNFKQKIYFSTTAALRATLDDGSRSKGPMNSSNLIGRKLEIKDHFFTSENLSLIIWGLE